MITKNNINAGIPTTTINKTKASNNGPPNIMHGITTARIARPVNIRVIILNLQIDDFLN